MKEQSMGQMVRRIRVEQGMTQEVLADGIFTTDCYRCVTCAGSVSNDPDDTGSDESE